MARLGMIEPKLPEYIPGALPRSYQALGRLIDGICLDCLSNTVTPPNLFSFFLSLHLYSTTYT
jgi:hypothetical protein